MRLINTTTYHLVSCDDADVPDYAILSHTLVAGQELTVHDWQLIHYEHISGPDKPDPIEDMKAALKGKSGYAKIESFLKQAQADGFDFAWTDIICVDRTSPTEVDDAATSVWNYYRDAGVCYVYLPDVEPGGLLWRGLWTAKAIGQFENGRWWTRSWTLMELGASRRMRFFASEWGFFGSLGEKAPRGGGKVREGLERYMGWDLGDIVARRLGTSIENVRRFGSGEGSEERAMSLMNGREAAREQDKVFTSMGPCDVRMDVGYGEGEDEACQRLSKVVRRKGTDKTGFAWGWGSVEDESPCLGLCACPFDVVRGFGTMARIKHFGRKEQSSVTSRGMDFGMESVRKSASESVLVLLNRCHVDDEQPPLLDLHPSSVRFGDMEDKLFDSLTNVALIQGETADEIEVARDAGRVSSEPAGLQLDLGWLHARSCVLRSRSDGENVRESHDRIEADGDEDESETMFPLLSLSFEQRKKQVSSFRGRAGLQVKTMTNAVVMKR